MPSNSSRPPYKRKRRKKRKRKAWVANVSKLEKEVEAVLKSLRYKFQAQVPMYSTNNKLRGIFDFFLTSHGVALEINGTFWHSDPRVYPDGPKYKTQRINARSWKRKTAQADRNGIKIIVLWEKDLRDAPDMKEFIKRELRRLLNDN